MHDMNNDIAKVLISEEQLQAKVAELGAQISRDYEGKDLLLVSILKGSVVFMADLMRAITEPCSIDFMVVSSYGGANTTSTGLVKIVKDLDQDLSGKDVLIVEDILDTGVTLSHLVPMLKLRRPNSVRLCTILSKPSRRKVDIEPDYCGFEVPDEFVVGYGLDYDEKYRNLPYVGVLKPEVYSIFEKRQFIGDVGTAKQGLATSDNNRFLRFWPEISFDKICFGISDCEKTIDSQSKWFPYTYIKGGTFRRWYPNKEYVVNYQNNGFEIKAAVMKKYPYLNNPDFVVKNTSAYFHAGITWSDVATGKFSARWVDDGYIFADAGPMLFVQSNPYVKMGYMNTPVFQMFCDLICQGLHYSTGQIPQIPYLRNVSNGDTIVNNVDKNIQLSKNDWDSFETSWDFKRSPLV